MYLTGRLKIIARHTVKNVSFNVLFLLCSFSPEKFPRRFLPRILETRISSHPSHTAAHPTDLDLKNR